LARHYFLVSDLHMGGDGQLQHCDYTTEFVAFLKELAKQDADTELIILAHEVFAADDKVAVFIFGHTHGAFVQRPGPAGQVVLNTGTWLKLLRRFPARVSRARFFSRRLLPLVSPELLSDPRGEQPVGDRLCRDSQETRA
jgi:UDP-2,3-diacylglucosamine pyrophosphatase LpxH